MAKVLCIGDLHIKQDNYNNLNLFTKQILQVVDDENVDIICVMGDTLHSFEKIKLDSINLAFTFFSLLHEKNKKLFLLIGNHDYANNEEFLSSRHAFNSMKLWSNTYVIDTVTEFIFNDLKFVFLPYIKDGRVIEALNMNNLQAPYSNITAFFGHSDFFGSSIQKISKLKSDIWEKNWPLSVNGHLHKYEKCQDNLIFVGTPYQDSYGDTSMKSVSVFSFKKDCFVEKRIEILLPKKILLHMTCEEFLKFENNGSDEIKIKLHGEKKEIERVLELKKNMENVKIEKKYTDKKIFEYVEKRFSFKERVILEVKKNPKIEKIFNELFV